MTRRELEALKSKLKKQKEKAIDMQTIADKLFGLLDRFSNLFPKAVKDIISKYKAE